MNFNPFEKNIENLEYSDLEMLIKEEVAEGWCVEYKRQFLDKYKIAKSIASFANSEGGWYIIGIEETRNVASKIIGIDLNETKNPENEINTIIKDQVTPIPFFKTKLIKCSENKGVLVVYIQKGHDVPYFTKKGKIYQRIGESSDPNALKDRYSFEKLMNRKDEFKLKFNSFAQNNYVIPIDLYNSKPPFLEFYIYLDNQEQSISDNFFSEEFFKEVKNNFSEGASLFNIDEIITPVIHFDNHYISFNSHILRYIDDNNQKSIDFGATLELFYNGHFKFIIPLSTLNFNSDYENINKYKEIISDDEKDYLTFIDLGATLWSLIIILEQYKRLLIKYNMDYNMYISINLKNMWRTTPFLDSKKFIDFIHTNKLPITLKSEISLPLYEDYIRYNLDYFNTSDFLIYVASELGFPLYLKESLLTSFVHYLYKDKK